MELNFNESIRELLRIGSNIRTYYDRELQPYHIGWAQHFLLQYIYDHPGVTALELGQIFLAEKSTVSKGVKRLSDEGYIFIRADEEDRRAKLLFPAPAAEEVVQAIRDRQEYLDRALSRSLTEGERVQLEHCLKKFLQTTLDMEKEPDHEQ